MQAEEVARKFDRYRREGKVWRARCPVHNGKSLSLAIYADDDRVGVHCFAGCSKDDILAAVGLTWRDTLYNDKTLTPAEKKEWARQKHLDELYLREQRTQNLRMWLQALNCKMKPVRTKNGFERDLERFCAITLGRL